MDTEIKIAREIGVVHNLLRQNANSHSMMSALREKVNQSEGTVIDYINHNKDISIYQKNIEQVLMIRRSTVTELLNKMERKGLIERQSVAIDKRLKRIVLTDKALECHADIQKQLEQLEVAVRSGLTEHEVIILHGILSKLKVTLIETKKNL